MIQQNNVQKKYNLPEKVKFCRKCTISNQRPRITFDKNGICSACNFAIFKQNKINWQERKEELKKLCDLHRKSDGSYDIIVPCSGGKDGSFVAHRLKNEYGMNPLCVTWAPLEYTNIGRENLDSFIKSGFNHLLGSPDPTIKQRLTELSFKELGDPFQPFIYGQANFPLQVSVKYNIPLIMYGENGEVEYGGDMKNAFKPNREVSDQINHYFSGLPPEYWIERNFENKDLFPYFAPPIEDLKRTKTQIHFFGYYEFWDPQENYYYCTEKTGFKPNEERSEGTYSKYASLDDKYDGFHFYLAYIKFGIGRTTSDTAHEIRDNKIERDEGIYLIKKYDGEFPNLYFKEFLNYCNISESEFEQVIDSWRSPHIWGKKKNGEWYLKHPIWAND